MEKEIRKCTEVLMKGGTILYPTDTVWGIGCDATNAKAVDKVYRIKKRLETKSVIILVDDEKRLKNYVKEIPEITRDLMKNVDRPLTIIYPNARNLPKNVLGEDNSIAIRIVKNDFCIRIIRELGKPIVSTSANISGETAPLVFSCVSENIKNSVDYVVPLYQDVLLEVKPSRIIRIKENGEFIIIRS